MRNFIAAALVLLTAPAAYGGPVIAPPMDLPPDPNPGSDLPPLGCLQMFPPYAWCLEQAEAAKAFASKCERMLRGDLDPERRDYWQTLLDRSLGYRKLWWTLVVVQDPANGGTEDNRRSALLYLYDRLGPDDFFAGRMPPPVPDDAPRD